MSEPNINKQDEAKLILETRAALEMNQEEFGVYLASHIGAPYSKQRISNWENAKNGMDILDVAIGKLAYSEDDPRGKLFRALWDLKASVLQQG